MKRLLWPSQVGMLVVLSMPSAWAADDRTSGDRTPIKPQISEVQQEEVQQEEVKKVPQSSFQLVFVGTVVSADRYNHTVTVRDKNRRIKTFYVDSSFMPSVVKGTTVQMRLQPGSGRVESIQKIIG